MKMLLLTLTTIGGLLVSMNSQAAVCRNGFLVGWTGPYSMPCGGEPSDEQKAFHRIYACGTSSLWTAGPDEMQAMAEKDMHAEAINLCPNATPVQITPPLFNGNPGLARACADFECR